MSVAEKGRYNVGGKVTFSPSPPSGAPTPFAAAEREREHSNYSTPIGAGKQPPQRPPPGDDSEEQRGRRRASLRIRLKNNGESGGGVGGDRAEEGGAEGASASGVGAGAGKRRTWGTDSNFRETVNSSETFCVRESVRTTRSTRDKEEEERRSSDYSRETLSFRGGDSEVLVTTKEDSSESASYIETAKPPRSILKKVSSYEPRAKTHPNPPPTPPPPPPPRPSASSPSQPPSPPPLPPKAAKRFREDFSLRAVREKEDREGGAPTPPTPPGVGRVHGWQLRRQQQQQRPGEAPASPTKTKPAPDSVKFLGGGARVRSSIEGEDQGERGGGGGDSGGSKSAIGQVS